MVYLSQDMRVWKTCAVTLGSEEFVPETKEKFLRESGVTQALAAH